MGLIFSTLAAIALIVGGILLPVAGRLLSSEIDAWMPRLVDLLIKRAVRRLPSDLQVRMDEEWRTFINDTPGTILKLLRAFGLSRGAIDIFRERTSSEGWTFAERAVTQLLGTINLFALLPIIVLCVAVLSLERPGPLIIKVRNKQNPARQHYRFLLGSGRGSQILSALQFDKLPMILNFVKGDIVISWTDWKTMFGKINDDWQRIYAATFSRYRSALRRFFGIGK
jgi:hypothetical protein